MKNHRYSICVTAAAFSLCLLFFATRASSAEEKNPIVPAAEKTSGVSASPQSSPENPPERRVEGEEGKKQNAPATEEKPVSGESRRIKYIGAFGAGQAEVKFTVIRALYMDEKSGEVYVADLHSDKIFIMSDSGTFLFSFKLFGKTAGDITGVALDKGGRVYVSGYSAVAVYTYKGDYIENLDLSGILGNDGNTIVTSVVIDGNGYIYLGISGIDAKIVKLDAKGKFISQIEPKGRFKSVEDLRITDEGFVFLDTRFWTVWKLDREGNTILSFGKLSSLLGGFSQPLGLDVDKAGRIYVVDSNRWMVIMFTPKGEPIVEFGGPGIFNVPSRVAVDRNGRVFVADGSFEIRVFQIVE